MIAAAYTVEPLTHSHKHSDLLEARHGHKNAQEEHDGAHVDAREQLAHTLLGAAFLAQVGIKQFGQYPQHAQHQQDAHERWQVSEGVENGYKDESTHAYDEHKPSLPYGEFIDVVVFVGLDVYQFAL